jgi:glycosyltransferase involved in cell wall biosynthesis
MSSNEKSIHVVYILTKLELGGAQKICLSLFRGARDLNAQSSLISGSDGVLLEEVKNKDSVYLLDSFQREVGFKNIINEFKTFLKIIRLLRDLKRKNKNILVHTHSTKAGILGRFAALFAGIKTRVHTVHGFGFNDYQSKPRWLAIYLVELVTSFITTHFVCVSNKDRETGSRLFPFFRKKSSLIRAAVDYEAFYSMSPKSKSFKLGTLVDENPTKPCAKSGLPARLYKEENKKLKGDFVFGSVSCFKPQKNLIDLLEAFKIVFDKVSNKKNIHLQIIGDGALRPQIEEWILKNGLVDNIQLLGWQKNVASIMKNWDCYVMSSLWEGLPCAIIEARLLRLPVVAYSVGGISEVVREGENGFLVKPEDIKTLASRMKKIATDSDLQDRLSSFSEDLTSFSNSYMVREHLDLYKQLIT